MSVHTIHLYICCFYCEVKTINNSISNPSATLLLHKHKAKLNFTGIVKQQHAVLQDRPVKDLSHPIY